MLLEMIVPDFRSHPDSVHFFLFIIELIFYITNDDSIQNKMYPFSINVKQRAKFTSEAGVYEIDTMLPMLIMLSKIHWWKF